MNPLKVVWSVVRPGFPGLAKYSDPAQGAKELTEDMRSKISSEKVARKAAQKDREFIKQQTREFTDAEMYSLWVDGLNLEQAGLEVGLIRRSTFGWLFIFFGVLLFGYGIGLARGLYVLSVSIFPVWLCATFVITTSISLILRGAKFHYHVWCIKNQKLPSFCSWISKLWQR